MKSRSLKAVKYEICNQDDEEALLKKNYFRMLDEVRQGISECMETMRINGSKPAHKELHEKLQLVLCDINDELCLSSGTLFQMAPLFDFKNVRANGYRTFLMVMEQCSIRLIDCLEAFSNRKKRIKSFLTILPTEAQNDLDAFLSCFHEISQCISLLAQSVTYSSPRYSLFSSDIYTERLEVQDWLANSDVAQEIFFGRCLGFYYRGSYKYIFHALGCLLAGYACAIGIGTEFRDESRSTEIHKAMHTFGYFLSNMLDPDQRGKVMTRVTRNAAVSFCKEFWSLSESRVALHAPLLVLPSLEVALNISLKVKAISWEDGKYQLPVADVFKDGRNVRIRLLCAKKRSEHFWVKRLLQSDSNEFPLLHENIFEHAEHPVGGCMKSSTTNVFMNFMGHIGSSKNPVPPSDYLLFHCHGGGFVGQSAKAHDIYLRFWAEKLDCPIVSVDYSLSPEYPYPHAIEETLFAYCWCLMHCYHLGCTGKRVVMVGDSAGGNIILGVVQRLIQANLPLSHGLMTIYTPVLISFTLSPSRLISLIDPLLPIGVLSRCLLAYAGVDESRVIQDYSNDATEGTDENISIQRGRPFSMNTFTSISDRKPWKRCFSCPSINKYYLTYSGLSLMDPLHIILRTKIQKEPLMSPLLMTDEVAQHFPPTVVIGCDFDPFLDDCVEFVKLLDRNGVPLRFHVFKNISHGFLHFCLLNSACRSAAMKCCEYLEMLFSGDDIRRKAASKQVEE